ncbi:MAG: ABC transporter ATP-binding protein [Acidobacteriaceae bacterium]|nr:ABC transporter ATP-binding protein [Acidobacteriaceae bacterium]
MGLIVGERILLGICDLLLAGAMYLMFLQLQGGHPKHHAAWIPQTALSSALCSVVLVVIRLLLDLGASHHVVRFTQKLYGEFSRQLVQGYSELRWNAFVQRNRSELVKHATSTALDAAYSFQIYTELIAGSVIVVLMATALVYQSVTIAACLSVIILLLYLLHRYILRRRLKLAAASREQSLRVMQRVLTEVFTSSKEIRAYGNQSFFYKLLTRETAIQADSNTQLALLPQFSRVVAEQGVILVFLGIILSALIWGGDIHQMLSLLIFYFVVSRRMLPLISQLALLFGQMDGAYENLSIVHQELKDSRTARTTTESPRSPEPGYALQLNHVTYAYDDGSRVLEDISFDLHAGTTMLLRGVSGSGKSSLLNLIAGVAEPTSGEVLIDRATAAYVPQEIAMLDESVRHNLLFGLAPLPDEVLMQALAIANLDQFVAALPQGLDTRVGDNGVLFSGGQRQRLGIARATLRGKKLLLLDEATSALDAENERQILERIIQCDTAVLIVTHRSDDIGIADRTLQLENGKLVEQASEPPSQ